MSLFFSLPGTNVVIHFHTVNRISRSHADDRFVRDDEGVGYGALLTDKLYPALAGMQSSTMILAVWREDRRVGNKDGGGEK